MSKAQAVHPAPWLITLPDVVQRTTFSRAQIYRLIKSGEFPRPIKLSAQRVAWDISAIDAWLAAKIGVAA